MKHHSLIARRAILAAFFSVFWSPSGFAADAISTEAGQVAAEPGKIPSPMFSDPNYESAADPEAIYNADAKEWWIFYTARRIMAEQNPGCGGCPIGVCASKDLISWRFVGYCKFDGVGGDKDGATTLWAPGLVRDHSGNYHMFVTFKRGAAGYWGEGGSTIRHYVAKPDDLLNGWTKVDDITTGPQTIDAGLLDADGQWWMWYRDIPARGSAPGTIFWATSPDLTTWTLHGQAPGDPNNQKVNGASYQEAPFAFRWKDHYWLITDTGPRLDQYRSDDLKTWTFTGPLLAGSGQKPLDKNSGKHPSVAVIDGRAFIFYFNHPFKAADPSALEKKKAGRSLLHISELKLTDGKLTCDRNTLVTPPSNVVPDDASRGK